jgi:hypothetical protein
MLNELNIFMYECAFIRALKIVLYLKNNNLINLFYTVYTNSKNNI